MRAIMIGVLVMAGTARGQECDDAALMRPVVSLHLCIAERSRAYIVRENEQKKRTLGVLKKRLTNEAFEEQIQYYQAETTDGVDEKIADLKERLRVLGVARLACASPDVKLLMVCTPQEGSSPDARICDGPRMKRLKPAVQAWDDHCGPGDRN